MGAPALWPTGGVGRRGVIHPDPSLQRSLCAEQVVDAKVVYVRHGRRVCGGVSLRGSEARLLYVVYTSTSRAGATVKPEVFLPGGDAPSPFRSMLDLISQEEAKHSSTLLQITPSLQITN